MQMPSPPRRAPRFAVPVPRFVDRAPRFADRAPRFAEPAPRFAARVLRLAVLALPLAACQGLAPGRPAPSAAPQRVVIEFAAKAGDAAVACGTPIAGLGTTSARAELRDLRFYVSEPALIDADGKTVPLRLDPGHWQTPALALIDLADDAGACAARKSAATNARLAGTAPAGDYRGLRFTVGVPAALNHSDYAAAAPPLDVQAMAWSWQAGRKFMQVELDPAGGVARSGGNAAPGRSFLFHLGATGCKGNPATGQTVHCERPNRVAVRLDGFDPARHRVVLDLAALHAGSNLREDRGGALGCMSAIADPECASLFRALGIDLASGRPAAPDAGRAVFRAQERTPLAAAAAGAVAEAGAVAAAPADGGAWTWALPAFFPEPRVPPGNPMSAGKVELGRHLFHDRRLSGNGTQACADCHVQSRAFTDGLALARGSTGQRHPRNAQGLANVAYHPTLTWANPALVTLEKQMEVPLFGTDPVEMGIDDGNKDEILARLAADPQYPPRFATAYPGVANPITWGGIIHAIAAFQRTLLSGNSRYDQYLRGAAALTPAQTRGMELFFGEKAECFHCHGSFNFNDQAIHAGSRTVETPFHNTGLYNVGGTGAFPEPNRGAYELTQDPADMGAFRAPSLRNVEVTGPYMHDGSIATLEEVLDFYAAGGREIRSGPHAGDGRANPYKNDLVNRISLDAQERADIVAFLKTLTDHEFLSDPRFSDPFTARPPAASGAPSRRAPRRRPRRRSGWPPAPPSGC